MVDEGAFVRESALTMRLGAFEWALARVGSLVTQEVVGTAERGPAIMTAMWSVIRMALDVLL